MSRKPLYESGPMTAAERQREKRARDKAIVDGSDSDETALSDSGLLEQLAINFRKDRKRRVSKNRGVITRDLAKELLRRLDEKPLKP